jgi:hypothetical protein
VHQKEFRARGRESQIDELVECRLKRITRYLSDMKMFTTADELAMFTIKEKKSQGYVGQRMKDS